MVGDLYRRVNTGNSNRHYSITLYLYGNTNGNYDL
jgi:hypothetical protein